MKQVWIFSHEYTIIKIKIKSGKFHSSGGVRVKAASSQ